MEKPFYAFNNNNDSQDEDEEADDEEADKYNLPVSEHPDWPYKIMASARTRFSDYLVKTTYTDPDNFSMYIYNDFHPYGVTEMLENLLIDFNNVRKKRGKAEDDLNEMWAIISMMTRWLCHPRSGALVLIDDGERCDETVDLTCCAFLTVLEEIDRAGELKANGSRFLDVGLIMALFISFVGPMPDTMSIEGANDYVPHIFEYANKAGIDLFQQGVSGIDRYAERYKPQKSQKSKAIDRWGFAKKVSRPSMSCVLTTLKCRFVVPRPRTIGRRRTQHPQNVSSSAKRIQLRRKRCFGGHLRQGLSRSRREDYAGDSVALEVYKCKRNCTMCRRLVE